MCHLIVCKHILHFLKYVNIGLDKERLIKMTGFKVNSHHNIYTTECTLANVDKCYVSKPLFELCKLSENAIWYANFIINA